MLESLPQTSVQSTASIDWFSHLSMPSQPIALFSTSTTSHAQRRTKGHSSTTEQDEEENEEDKDDEAETDQVIQCFL